MSEEKALAVMRWRIIALTLLTYLSGGFVERVWVVISPREYSVSGRRKGLITKLSPQFALTDGSFLSQVESLVVYLVEYFSMYSLFRGMFYY